MRISKKPIDNLKGSCSNPILKIRDSWKGEILIIWSIEVGTNKNQFTYNFHIAFGHEGIVLYGVVFFIVCSAKM